MTVALLDLVESTAAKIRTSGGTVETLAVAEPVGPAAVAAAESALGMPLTDFQRDVWTTEASAVLFTWRAELPKDVDAGYLHLLAPDDCVEVADELRETLEETRDTADADGWQAASADWPFWVPVFRFRSADLICADTRSGRAVFAEHDVLDTGPNLHGLILGQSVEDFVGRWAEVGFVDVWDWERVVADAGLDLASPLLEPVVELLTP